MLPKHPLCVVLLLAALILSACQPVMGPPTVLVKGAHIRSPNGIKVGPDGNLYVASMNERAILVIDPDTGEILKRLGPEAGVHGPDDLAVGPDGSIYWTDFFKGTVGRLAPDGSMSSQMVAPGVNPIVFSPDGRAVRRAGLSRRRAL